MRHMNVSHCSSHNKSCSDYLVCVIIWFGLCVNMKIFLSANESQFWHDIWTNVSAAEAFVYSLSKDVAYHIQIAAYNNVGEGVRSDPLLVG